MVFPCMDCYNSFNQFPIGRYSDCFQYCANQKKSAIDIFTYTQVKFHLCTCISVSQLLRRAIAESRALIT